MSGATVGVGRIVVVHGPAGPALSGVLRAVGLVPVVGAGNHITVWLPAGDDGASAGRTVPWSPYGPASSGVACTITARPPARGFPPMSVGGCSRTGPTTCRVPAYAGDMEGPYVKRPGAATIGPAPYNASAGPSVAASRRSSPAPVRHRRRWRPGQAWSRGRRQPNRSTGTASLPPGRVTSATTHGPSSVIPAEAPGASLSREARPRKVVTAPNQQHESGVSSPGGRPNEWRRRQRRTTTKERMGHSWKGTDDEGTAAHDRRGGRQARRAAPSGAPAGDRAAHRVRPGRTLHPAPAPGSRRNP